MSDSQNVRDAFRYRQELADQAAAKEKACRAAPEAPLVRGWQQRRDDELAQRERQAASRAELDRTLRAEATRLAADAKRSADETLGAKAKPKFSRAAWDRIGDPAQKRRIAQECQLVD